MTGNVKDTEPMAPSSRRVTVLAALVLVLATVTLSLIVRKRLRQRDVRPVPPLDTETTVQLDEASMTLARRWRESGRVTGESLRDRWGRAYIVRETEVDGRPMLHVSTLGKDGQPGGAGSDRDYWMVVDLQEDEAQGEGSPDGAASNVDSPPEG